MPTPTGWLWEFGDGTTSSTQHPAHTYTTQGVYDVRLTVTNAAGSRSTLKPAFIGVGPVGLKGEYFGSPNLTGLRAVRIDPTVDFDWTGGSPDPSLGSVQFSVRWTGQVVPQFSELYTFCTMSDDGVRLWVNSQPVVDNWTDHAPTENCGTIALVGGQSSSIRMEYYQAPGAAVARLLWSSASQPKQVIPQNRLYLPGAGPPPPPPTPLTVTLNQAASQPDPTSSPSITFTVGFSARSPTSRPTMSRSRARPVVPRPWR